MKLPPITSISGDEVCIFRENKTLCSLIFREMRGEALCHVVSFRILTLTGVGQVLARRTYVGEAKYT